MLFNLVYFMKDPDPHQWIAVFCHEYSHNDHKDHGPGFVCALQSRCADVMRHLDGASARVRGSSAPPKDPPTTKPPTHRDTKAPPSLDEKIASLMEIFLDTPFARLEEVARRFSDTQSAIDFLLNSSS